MSRKAYPSDLSAAQWELLRPVIEKPASHGGTHRKYALVEIVNALLYVLKSGCQWEMIPHDFRRGKVCTITIGAGRRTARWSGCTICCEDRSA